MPPSTADAERCERALKRSIIMRDANVRNMNLLHELAKKVEDDENLLPLFKVRKRDLESILHNINTEQGNIIDMLLELDRESEYQSKHVDVEAMASEKYYFIKAIADALPVDDPPVGNLVKTDRSHIQLPNIQIPNFDGDILRWCAFRDTFISLVHANTSLSNIERFHYLLSAVSGSASSVVRSIPLSDANYPVAWSALNERYDNQRLIMNAHLDKLFSFPQLKSSTLPDLKYFLETFQENIAALSTFAVPDKVGFLLFYIASRVLDPDTKCLFESEHKSTALLVVDDLLTFVKSRCHILQNSSSLANLSPSFKTKFSSPTKKTSSFVRTSLVAISPSSAKTSPLCGDNNPSSSNSIINVLPSSSDNASKAFVGTASSISSSVLGTAVIRICDKFGQWLPVRALIDSGSQISAITHTCAIQFGLSIRPSKVAVVGLSQIPVAQPKGFTKCNFVSHSSASPIFTCEAFILAKITGPLPLSQLSPCIRSTYKDLDYADPAFDHPGRIDFLLGADVYNQIFEEGYRVRHASGLSSAFETTLGWIFVGTNTQSSTSSSKRSSFTLMSEPSLHHILRQFWNVKEPVQPAVPTTEDELCEKWFSKTTSRSDSGRFSVALPFLDVVHASKKGNSMDKHSTTNTFSSSHGLGESRNNALKRLYNLESRLTKDIELYEAIMEDYLALGHMKKASRPGKYFIPHHAVVKRDGDVSKIRVVFDASAPSSSGRSLNDVLAVGPKLQTDISDILLRCRLSKFVFIADIAKMYRQILVRPEDCVYQHILWRSSPEYEVQEYELLTVTYGVSSAPYLAIRCLHELDAYSVPHFPAAKGILTDKTYVDDIIAGPDSEDELVQVQEHIVGLLGSAGCVLKKWASNSTRVLDRIPIEDRAQRPSFDPDIVPSIKVLGLHWDPCTDAFGYHTNIRDTRLTKRGVLSTIARLFDPIGALGPMLLWAKCFMQQLWLDKFGWDTPLSPLFCTSWDQFISELPSLSHIALRRHLDIRNYKEIQLLGFADASQVGYAATTFLRVKYDNERICVYFLTGKTKVAPLRTIQCTSTLTIPRLELCAALLLAQLLQRLTASLSCVIKISRTRAWTDSSIVLSWLMSDEKVFKMFISNRVAKIHALVPNCEWAHISTSNNPADPSSRGLSPMLSCHLHWNGPDFIYSNEDEWPKSRFIPLSINQLPEIKPITQTCLVSSKLPSMDNFLYSFSSLTRLQRSLAYSLRFVYARFLKQPCSGGPLSCAELNRATRVLVRVTQRTYFSELLKQLSKPEAIITPPTVAQLAPFLDECGLIRVG